MEANIDEHIEALEASLSEKFDTGFQKHLANYVESAQNRSGKLIEQELETTKKRVEERLGDIQEAIQHWKTLTTRVLDHLSGSEVWPESRKRSEEVTSRLPKDILLLVERSSQICTSLYLNAFNPDDLESQRAEILQLCVPAVEIVYRRKIPINSGDVLGSRLKELSHRLSQIKVDTDKTETDTDFQRLRSIDDAFERNRARRHKIGPEDYLTLSPNHNSENLNSHTYNTLPRHAKGELDGFLHDVFRGQGEQNGPLELRRNWEGRDFLVKTFASFALRNTDISEPFFDQFQDLKEAAKRACRISDEEILSAHRSHINKVELLFDNLKSGGLNRLSEIFSSRNARDINDIRDADFFRGIARLKNSLIATSREQWIDTQENLVEGLQEDNSSPDQQDYSLVIKEIESKGATFLENIPSTVDRWISNRFSEVAEELSSRHEEAAAKYERGLTVLSESLDTGTSLSSIESEATRETETRYASIERHIERRDEQLRSKLLFLYRDISLEVVIPQWRTFGILTKPELLYYLLKVDLRRARDHGVTTDDLSNNRQKLSAMSELVSLGCAARVINGMGETIFFADDLLEHLDDMSLREMGDGSTKTFSLESSFDVLERRQIPAITDRKVRN
ncbi:hypothetical protein KUW17_18890 [Leisingera aquaemixtae]|uniref:hypothetical protein n=1 Tax=Leisingera aquaemixtae TaxID=1396826 RepID=UPI001C964E4E|nr:hypothetical protein [Leisingera aquaemixtae]MBY6068817.1 hypothetical protein [Leisingera aquaemixtae]